MKKKKYYTFITCFVVALMIVVLPCQVHAEGYQANDVPVDDKNYISFDDKAEYTTYYYWYQDKQYQQSVYNIYQVKDNDRVAFSSENYFNEKYTDSTKTALLFDRVYNLDMFLQTDEDIYYFRQYYYNDNSKWADATSYTSLDMSNPGISDKLINDGSGNTFYVNRFISASGMYSYNSYDDNSDNDCLAKTNIPIFENDYDCAMYVLYGEGLENCINISDVLCDEGQIYDTRDGSIYDGTLPTFQTCTCHINRNNSDIKKYTIDYNYTLPTECTESGSPYYIEFEYDWQYDTSYKASVTVAQVGVTNFTDNKYKFVTTKNCNTNKMGIEQKLYDVYKDMKCYHGILLSPCVDIATSLNISLEKISKWDLLANKFSYPAMVTPKDYSIGIGDIIDGLDGANSDLISWKTNYSLVHCTARICKSVDGVIYKGNKNNFYINLVDNTVECDIAEVSEGGVDKTVDGSYSDNGSIGDVSNSNSTNVSSGNNQINININNTNNGSSDSGSSGGSSGGIDGSLFGQWIRQ